MARHGLSPETLKYDILGPSGLQYLGHPPLFVLVFGNSVVFLRCNPNWPICPVPCFSVVFGHLNMNQQEGKTFFS